MPGLLLRNSTLRPSSGRLLAWIGRGDFAILVRRLAEVQVNRPDDRIPTSRLIAFAAQVKKNSLANSTGCASTTRSNAPRRPSPDPVLCHARACRKNIRLSTSNARSFATPMIMITFLCIRMPRSCTRGRTMQLRQGAAPPACDVFASPRDARCAMSSRARPCENIEADPIPRSLGRLNALSPGRC